jgi:transcriptional regulator with PAS, ATPase and Fis domain
LFQAYSWPGNVREFENCIEYMINMHESGILSPSLVPLKIRNAVAAAPAPSRVADGISAGKTESGDAPGAPVVPLAELEAEAIRKALARYGNTTEGKIQAATALGIGIATLYRKIQTNQGSRTLSPDG